MKKLFILCILTLPSLACAKDIYKWTEGGQTYYGDTPRSANAVIVSQPIMTVPRGVRVNAEALAADRKARAEKQQAETRHSLANENCDPIPKIAQNQYNEPLVVAGWNDNHYPVNAHRGLKYRNTQSHKPMFRGSYERGRWQMRLGGGT
ncbi:MAG: DUF4124 domain-containing protein [Azoarcus sp.]|jgi:hypothetical protein|nr:DUF4124 domain-containing protein [Azoarcus sp.]